jgi:RNA polymerase sigma factor (TIGR02999 family)
MAEPGQHDVTQWLQLWSQGEQDALEPLMDLVYQHLQGQARSYLNRERQDPMLESRALVHEAFLRLVRQDRVEWASRAHFYAVAAQTMRRILVDHARRLKMHKHGGDLAKVDLEKALQLGGEVSADVVALDDALKALATVDPDKARLVEMRFFGGLAHGEIAEVLGVSIATVDRHWRLAKAWLYQALHES